MKYQGHIMKKVVLENPSLTERNDGKKNNNFVTLKKLKGMHFCMLREAFHLI